MDTNITKVSATEIGIAQPIKVISLDQLMSKKESQQKNIDQVTKRLAEETAKMVEIDALIAKAQSLKVKTAEELKPVESTPSV